MACISLFQKNLENSLADDNLNGLIIKGKLEIKTNSQTPEKKIKQSLEKKERDTNMSDKRENNRIKENKVETHPASPVPGPKKVPSTSKHY